MKYLKIIPWILMVGMFIYLAKCQPDHVTEKIVRDTVTVVRLDTVLVEREKPIYITEYVDKPTIVYVDSSGVKTYSDTTFVETDFYLWYSARVLGNMEEISLSFYDNRPERIVTKTIDNTIREKHYIQPKKLMFGLDVNTLGDLSPGMIYVRKNWAFKGNYNINQKAVSTGAYVGF